MIWGRPLCHSELSHVLAAVLQMIPTAETTSATFNPIRIGDNSLVHSMNIMFGTSIPTASREQAACPTRVGHINRRDVANAASGWTLDESGAAQWNVRCEAGLAAKQQSSAFSDRARRLPALG